MLPSRCRLMMAGLEDDAWRTAKLGFWQNVAGVDMSALAPLATATFCGKPQHRLVEKEGLIGEPMEICAFDLLTVQEADLKHFEAPLCFVLPASRRLDGFATWFECEFGAAGWLLSTG